MIFAPAEARAFLRFISAARLRISFGEVGKMAAIRLSKPQATKTLKRRVIAKGWKWKTYMRYLGSLGGQATQKKYARIPVGQNGWAIVNRATGELKATIDASPEQAAIIARLHAERERRAEEDRKWAIPF